MFRYLIILLLLFVTVSGQKGIKFPIPGLGPSPAPAPTDPGTQNTTPDPNTVTPAPDPSPAPSPGPSPNPAPPPNQPTVNKTPTKAPTTQTTSPANNNSNTTDPRTTSNNIDPNPQPGGLSTPAIAAIVISFSLCFVLIITLALWYSKQKQNRHPKTLQSFRWTTNEEHDSSFSNEMRSWLKRFTKFQSVGGNKMEEKSVIAAGAAYPATENVADLNRISIASNMTAPMEQQPTLPNIDEIMDQEQGGGYLPSPLSKVYLPSSDVMEPKQVSAAELEDHDAFSLSNLNKKELPQLKEEPLMVISSPPQAKLKTSNQTEQTVSVVNKESISPKINWLKEQPSNPNETLSKKSVMNYEEGTLKETRRKSTALPSSSAKDYVEMDGLSFYLTQESQSDLKLEKELPQIAMIESAFKKSKEATLSQDFASRFNTLKLQQTILPPPDEQLPTPPQQKLDKDELLRKMKESRYSLGLTPEMKEILFQSVPEDEV